MRCWFCLGLGHLASRCPKCQGFKSTLPPLLPNPPEVPVIPAKQATVPTSVPPPQTSSGQSSPSVLAPAKGAMDGLALRPDADSVVISTTREAERLRHRFATCSLVAWSVGEMGDRVDPATFADDVRIAFNIHRRDIQVTKFHPEDFFVTPSTPANRESILRQERLETASGRIYQFSPWTTDRHGQCVKFRYRVRLCLEGIPMHGRTEAIVAKLIGWQCSIHFVEEYSCRRNYNRTYDLWVWTSDLSFIHKASWLILADPDEEGLAIDIPLPDVDPNRNPPPTDEKPGWLYFCHHPC